MANIDGLPVNSAVTHAEFMSRTEDTSTAGKVDFNNTTDSTDPTNGSIHTAGGLGVEKSLNVGQNASVSGELIVAGETTLNDTLNASDVNAATIVSSGNISSGSQLSGSTLSITGSGVIGGDLTVNGNATINGTTTTVNSTVVDIVDKNITVNKNGSNLSSEGSGLTVDRLGTKGSLIYKNSSASRFAAGDIGSEIDLVNISSAQSLTNKTIVASSNTVTTAASGNLTSTELNDALSELQSDIDTRATSSSLTAHTGASSGVHGIVGSVVGTTDTQTLTNKTLTSPVINTPTGITKSDVGLANVDNTSDATKNSATATLTNKTISGLSNTITNVSLTTGVTGILPASNGGTGQSSYVVGDILYASATNALTKLSAGASGQVLTSNGAGVAPSYQSLPTSSYTTKFVYARHTSGQAYTANQTATLVYNSELEDPSNLYNNTTGTFTADENGFYVCFATATITTTVGTQQTIGLRSLFNGSVAGIGYYNTETTGGGTPARQVQVISSGRLLSGQTIVVQFINNGQANSITTTAEQNVLFIYKVGN